MPKKSTRITRSQIQVSEPSETTKGLKLCGIAGGGLLVVRVAVARVILQRHRPIEGSSSRLTETKNPKHEKANSPLLGSKTKLAKASGES